jgi:predicted RNase H-like HicB family nuclease
MPHKNTYTVVFTPEKDGWYSVHCLELPVASQGHGLEEARAMITEAIQMCLEDRRHVERQYTNHDAWEETIEVEG